MDRIETIRSAIGLITDLAILYLVVAIVRKVEGLLSFIGG